MPLQSGLWVSTFCQHFDIKQVFVIPEESQNSRSTHSISQFRFLRNDNIMDGQESDLSLYFSKTDSRL